MDRIMIRDLLIDGIVGVNPSERTTRQPVLVNVTMWADTKPASLSDAIDDTVNYRTISKAFISHIEQGSPQLVERLAAELVSVCFASDRRITEVELTVEKPGALRHARSVGVTIRRRREEADHG
ncbi:MAG: dihydroneopterin aldolase [Acidimicrobiia bacterium]